MCKEKRHLPIPLDRIKAEMRIDATSPTGLRWIKYKPGRRKDLQAGTTTGRYCLVSLDGTSYRCHRIIYALHTGEDPGELVIDHDNGASKDNAPDNLRPTDNLNNCANRHKTNRNNTSGVKGVCWHKQMGKWWARVMRKGKTVASAFFDDLAEADLWVSAKRLEVFKEFAADRYRQA